LDRLRAMTRSFPLMATAVVLMMITVIGAAAIFRLRTASTLASLRALTEQADRVGEIGQGLLTELLDAESNARAYLLTHNPNFLVPYTTARVGVTASLSELDAAAGRLAPLAGDLEAIHTQAAARLDLLSDSILTAGLAPDATPLPSTGWDAGLDLMRQTRSAIERIVQHAGQERDHRSTEEQDHENAIRAGVTLLGFAGILLLGGASLALLRGRERLLRTQEALQAQSGLWQATVENLQDGVAVFDEAGGLVQWNRSLAPLTGFADDLLRPGTPLGRFANAAAHWQPPVLASLVSGAVPTAAEIKRDPPVEVRAGGRVLDVSHNEMPGGGRMLTIGDITRRVDAEAIARQAQKMDVLGQLTGGVAHDFNNLLQVVSANLELMSIRVGAGDAPPPAWLRARLLAAMAGVNRGARLTRHLLAFARRQPLTPESIDAGRLLSGLEDMLRRTLGPAIALQQVIADDLWALRADPQQLENAILNLAINARDAMSGNPPDRARLVIEVRNSPLDQAYCEANPEVVPGQYVMISVSDSGCGMTAEQIARAVEPFYTTKPEGQGTGLGLSMVYGFAKQSGGLLKLYSEPGHGTTARLYIPRTTAIAALQEVQPGPAKSGHDELVLLIEDDPAVRAAAGLALRGLGYRVEEAANADDGMATIEQGLRPDLVFTDVMMPGTLSAHVMAERAQALVPGLAVMFTSGYTESASIFSGQLEPNVHLISKPWRLVDLASRLRQALDQARPRAPERLRILLVEDDELVRMITADMLAELGHEVIEAADVAQAMGQIDGVGLLITDLGLGAGTADGLTLTAAARAQVPGLPVIIATGRTQPEAGAEVSTDGLFWLAKPYDNAALKAALQSVFAPAA
jgi:signal transduction histidine kinase/DNA-binding response OmpR family regulator